MEAAYKPYVDYILAEGVAETAYILGRDGSILGTNLPITQMPSYNYELEDEKDPTKTHTVVVDEKASLLQTLANKGVPKAKYGLRLYNQKYVAVRFDEDTNTLYLKKDKGGACVVVTAKLILIGTFNAGQKMSNGVMQNPGELNKRVETLAKNLKGQGY